MPRRFDPARFHYWRIEFIQPNNPNDDRNVMLHGAEGEVVGPMTMSLAESWMDRFDGSPAVRVMDPSPCEAPETGSEPTEKPSAPLPVLCTAVLGCVVTVVVLIVAYVGLHNGFAICLNR